VGTPFSPTVLPTGDPEILKPVRVAEHGDGRCGGIVLARLQRAVVTLSVEK
jgi:hypothetical protein